MIKSFRTILGIFLGRRRELAAPAELMQRRPIEDTPDPPPLSRVSKLTLLMETIETNSDFRARFAEAPETIMIDWGVDPAPYNLRSPMRDQDIDRLVAQWKSVAEPKTSIPYQFDPVDASPSPPVVIYGPPPGSSGGRR